MRTALLVVAVLATLLTTTTSTTSLSQQQQDDSSLAYPDDSEPLGTPSALSTITATSQPREAYFDGGAWLRLRASFVSVHLHSGLSFRSCEPGKLFEQRYDGGDAISLRVDHDGLVFAAKLQQRRLEARLNAKLLDNLWHNVNMFFRLGNLTLSAAGHAQVIANATYNSEILTLPDHNANGTLTVGEGFRGCILQGPNLLFNDSVSYGAAFGACPLDTRACGPLGSSQPMTTTMPTTTITATTMTTLSSSFQQQQSSAGPDWCQHAPCMMRGRCVSRHDRYECHCYARYSGNNCQNDNGPPCLSNPCRNGAICSEDKHGDYSCECAPGYAGLRCESPIGTRLCDSPTNNPCRNDASCVELPDLSYRCDCRPGFAGKHCEVDVDECANNPCKNDGNCTDLVNGYVCKCDRTGYKGANCEIDIDECENANPCLNDGACFNNYGGYVCVCPTGFEGQNCELNINECLSAPCQNGGRCVDEVGSYRCNCTATGYVGDHCELPPQRQQKQQLEQPPLQQSPQHTSCENAVCPPNSICISDTHGLQCVCKPGYMGIPGNCTINYCANNPCNNGGTCTSLKDRFECSCTPEWKGPACQLPIPNWCPICYNGGTCIETARGHAVCQCPRFWTGVQCKEPVTCSTHHPCKRATECRDYPVGYYCVCEPGWTGPECSIDIDECTSDPCRNGGICIDQLSNYYCQCLTGFTGKNCQINVDECMSQPCQNGGSCVDQANGYSCNCTRDYMGENCEREYEACSLNPCQNNGSCIPNAKSRRDFVCKCAAGFEGKVCDIDVDECVGVVCADGKVCVDIVAGYECKCPDGYREPNCTELVDPCASRPCYNNASCVEMPDESYKCECGAGFAGANCEHDFDECKQFGNSLCNNGICVNTLGSYNCYCTPGFSGDHCEFDIDECLCGPCQNNATCIDRVNTFECKCPPGYTGKTCSQDIDECATKPCQNGATCVDEIAKYTCMCATGFSGQNCEINIDDCESQPCKNNGICLDGINAYTCNCTDSGFEGEHCEINIDDCAPNPCKNGATCIDGIKDYTCHCYDGYTDKNCTTDINECESSPCQYNGTCLERSNKDLYKDDVMNKPSIFMGEFSYANASGYECICVQGVTGKNCEININECDSNPCKDGTCMDLIGGFSCECDDGVEGLLCDVEVNECLRYSPCEHGVCVDKRADYYCSCEAAYGGKNCSVVLTGCDNNACMNNGECKPYVVNETEHKFNCTCPHGFYGELCDRVTTMSFSGKSHVLVNTTREEGYDIQFSFRTTLPNALLAMGKGPTYYILALVGGKLNLHSSLLNKWNGVFIGSGLNDSNWQKVFVAINATHLVLSANDEQTIYPINLNEGANATYTSFSTTYIGSTEFNLKTIPHEVPIFTGCTEDLIINGEWIYTGMTANHVVLQNIESGCPREPQCSPNPCKNNGYCTDQWRDFSCKCERPYLGYTCQYNMTAATFGYENTTNGYVSVKVSDPARRAVRMIVDISMFIRTREQDGDVFYLGSESSASVADGKDNTYIAAQLEGGELLVRMQFNGTEAYTVGGVKLNDGNNHLIQVIRNVTLVQVKINGTEYFRKTINANGQLNVTVLYLGGIPQFSRSIRQVSDNRLAEVSPKRASNFKGIIQDVQISNGTGTMVVEFYPLKARDIPVLKEFGKVSFDPEKVLEGVVSDNVCSSNPCYHNGTCHVTWNDFSCQCPRGYTGKTCQEMEFCQLQDCPTGSKCQNLDDGYECMANATFDGISTSFTYVYNHAEETNLTESSVNSIKITYRSNTGGTLMHISPKSGISHFTVSVYKDKVTVAWKLDLQNMGVLSFGKNVPDGNWTTILLKLNNDSIEALYEDASDEPTPQTSSNFNFAIWYELLLTGSLTLGGLGAPLSDRHSYTTFGMERRIETRDSIRGNSVDFTDRKLTTAMPPHSMMSGEAFQGCIGEVRIGSMLLHYFTYEEVYQNANFTPLEFMSLQQENNATSHHDSIGCRLCFDSNCKNNGHCLDQFNSYICECPAGYKDDDCATDIDECIDNQCSNNSTCVDGVANYTCICKDGWQGWLCKEDINECETDRPCQNDGVCVNEPPGSFRCDCTEKYIGEFCEQFKLITCANEPCKNGSTCSDVVNQKTGDNFTCSCMPGYEGNVCDTPYCVRRKCENNGKCVFNYQQPQCSCPLGFTGLYCETNIDDCAPDLEGNVPCKNEGKCHDGINSYTCDCLGTGYTGVDCSQDINECDDLNSDCGSGTCENTPGSYRCVCQKGFCGMDCKLPDPCEGTEFCKNGGSCICTQDDPGYTCQCAPDYTGQNCTESEHVWGSQAVDIAVIVGPIVGILFLIAAGSLIALFMMARKKRATRGTYSPSAQEFSNPRVEMDNVMKPPPEERLI